MKDKVRRNPNSHVGGGILDNLKSFATSDFAKGLASNALGAAAQALQSSKSGSGLSDLLGSQAGVGKKRRHRKVRYH